jgi:hypothetical protein
MDGGEIKGIYTQRLKRLGQWVGHALVCPLRRAGALHTVSFAWEAGKLKHAPPPI